MQILKAYFSDRVKGRELQADGSHRVSEGKGRERQVQSQEALYEEAVELSRKARQLETTVFEPHLLPSQSA